MINISYYYEYYWIDKRQYLPFKKYIVQRSEVWKTFDCKSKTVRRNRSKAILETLTDTQTKKKRRQPKHSSHRDTHYLPNFAV